MATQETSIAVLPFVNLSPNPEHEYFSDGITEEIIGALAQINQLRVTSRTSSFYFKGQNLPLQEIAKSLAVEVILEGSVRVAAKQIRISAQLIQAQEDVQFWSESWDRKLDNIFAIQDEISLLIADKLREQFGHLDLQDQLVPKQTETFSAYKNVLRAKQYFNKWNPEDINIAIQYYELALAQDPNYAEAYVGLADAYSFLATVEYIPRAEGWQKAMAFTEQASKLSPRHAGVLYLQANQAFFVGCDFTSAWALCQDALKIRPSYPEALHFLAFLATISGDLAGAEGPLQKALMLDPYNQETHFFRAYFYYRKGAYAEALSQLEESLKKNERSVPAYVLKAYCLLSLERYDEVLNFLDQIPVEIAVEDDHLGIGCLAYIRSGNQAMADQSMDQLIGKSQQPFAFQAHSYRYLALVNLGKTDEAFEWIDRCLEHKSSILLLSYTSPLAESIRSDARYAVYHHRLYGRLEPMSSNKASKTPLLNEAAALDYSHKLLTYMDAERPFLNPNLSLRLLAAQLEMHPNQLSWLLNERQGQNFNTFINTYRVDYFKQLALDPANAHISLLGLAYESGFNSKTVFNTAFKKISGMTPRAFVRQSETEL